jgi:hypothetical protein
LATQIREAVASEYAGLDARQLAIYGQLLSTFKLLTHRLKTAYKEANMEFPNTNSSYAFVQPEMSPAQRRFQALKEIMCDIFIKAVLIGDKKTILELADAADFFKGKWGDEDFTPADPERLKLLKIKSRSHVTASFPKSLTIRQIAERVYGKKNLEKYAEGGFSALRRKCKEMGVKIRPSRKTKQK